MIFFIIPLCFSYEEYKKCNDMRFCSHNINAIGKWSLNNCNFNKEKYEFTGSLFNNNVDDKLQLIIYLMQNNSFRVSFLPANKENFPRYNLSGNSYVVNQEIMKQHLPLRHNNESNIHVISSEECKAEIHLSPFYINISDKFNSKILINYNQNLVFEHIGQQVPPDFWPHYQNDTIKNGATAVGIDFAFQGKNTRISGFAEADNSINFEDTGDEPRRVSNYDSFSDYGHIPLVYGHSPSEMISFFWMNPSDTFIKIKTDDAKDMRNIRILSEGGYADIVVFTGKIFSILDSYTNLTGRHEIPPLFTLGYHQSKWGYLTQKEVETIVDELDSHDFPLDVLWLDVDHLHHYQPFRINMSAFPNPDSLFKKLSNLNRYVVRLNDPHLPKDDTHTISKYALEHGYYVNNSDGKTPFNGNCWPGSSYWPDFLNPEVHKWWSTLFPYKDNETAPNVYFWNDMNEPSVFDSVEGTFPKDLVYYGGYEEREIRSLYGLLMHSATYEGVVNRNPDHNIRPFILTRSFFAGSQKYTWMWSGDNTAKYDHLKHSVPMSIIAGLCGMPMTGSDLGGFSGDTTPQLLSRWHQAALFGYPLFRNHCSEDSPHREPYLYDNYTLGLLRNTTKRRYQSIPLWYTAVQNSHQTGIPPVLPLFALYPEQDDFHDVDDQFIFSESLLVAPILVENAQTKKIVKPPGIWYNLTNGQILNKSITISVNNESLPIYVKGGSIVPFFTKVGKSAEETRKSPISLIVGCDENGNARGPLYIDDGISYNYRNGQFMNRWIIFKDDKIQIEKRSPIEKSIPSIAENTYINEIKFYGLKNLPKLISKDAELSCNEARDICTMKGFKLYPSKISEEEKNKKRLYFLIGIIAAIVVSILIIVVIIVVSVIACKKNKEKRELDAQNRVDSRSLIDSVNT